MKRFFRLISPVAAVAIISLLAITKFSAADSKLGPPVTGDRNGLPVLAMVPDFELTDATGRKMRRDDLRGRPWIAAFIFTRCAGQCPVMTSRMKRLERLTEARLVFFSVDPADSPAVLSRYAKANSADWLFLTGRRGQVRRLSIEGFHLPADAGGAGRSVVHSDKLVLVDGNGRIRGYFDGTAEASLDALVRATRGLTQ